jgi:hypothetical protein
MSYEREIWTANFKEPMCCSDVSNRTVNFKEPMFCSDVSNRIDSCGLFISFFIFERREDKENKILRVLQLCSRFIFFDRYRPDMYTFYALSAAECVFC